MNVGTLITICLLLVVSKSVNGIQCYECNMQGEDECFKLNSCAVTKDGCDHCVTVQTSVNVTRNCITSALNIEQGEFCTDGLLEDGSPIRHCYCNGDLCNSKTLPNPVEKLFSCYTCSASMNETEDNGGSCFIVDKSTTMKEGCGVCTVTIKANGVLRQCIPKAVDVPNGKLCMDNNSTGGPTVCFCNNHKCNSQLVEDVNTIKNEVDGLFGNCVLLLTFSTFLALTGML